MGNGWVKNCKHQKEDLMSHQIWSSISLEANVLGGIFYISMELQLSCQRLGTVWKTFQKQNAPFNRLKVSTASKHDWKSLYQLRNHHHMCSVQLHVHVCYFIHGLLVVKLNVPLKAVLDFIPEGEPRGYTWLSKYPSVCVCIFKQAESFRMSDKSLTPP